MCEKASAMEIENTFKPDHKRRREGQAEHWLQEPRGLLSEVLAEDDNGKDEKQFRCTQVEADEAEP